MNPATTSTSRTSASDRNTRHNPTESVQHRAMRTVSEYNRQLNQERKEERRVCMDLQTYTVQYPVGLGRDNKGLRWWMKKRRRVSPLWRAGRRFPVSLLPSQYQDWFLQYTPQELKYFPLNTIVHGPVPGDFDNVPPAILNTNSDSDVDGSDVLSDFDDNSSCCCDEDQCSKDNSAEGKESPDMTGLPNASGFDENSCPSNLFPNGTDLALGNNAQQNMSHDTTGMPNDQGTICKVCNCVVTPDKVLRCADCAGCQHASCADISGELLEVVRRYRWQCQDCKSCNQCGHPHDEEKMMFCDKCDRGYHTYCVGLTAIPEGHWVCALCALCANCGTNKPSQSATLIGWQHELIRIHTPNGETLVRHQVFCETCYQLRKI